MVIMTRQSFGIDPLYKEYKRQSGKVARIALASMHAKGQFHSTYRMVFDLLDLIN